MGTTLRFVRASREDMRVASGRAVAAQERAVAAQERAVAARESAVALAATKLAAETERKRAVAAALAAASLEHVAAMAALKLEHEAHLERLRAEPRWCSRCCQLEVG